jgi:hypothetical protein
MDGSSASVGGGLERGGGLLTLEEQCLSFV